MKRKYLSIAISIAALLTSTSSLATHRIQNIDMTSNGAEYPCFIRVDFSNLIPSNPTCSGTNCQVRCVSNTCIVLSGVPSTSPEPISCTMTVTTSFGNDTFSHISTNENTSTQPTGVTDSHSTGSDASKVCPNGFSTCAYWKSISSQNES